MKFLFIADKTYHANDAVLHICLRLAQTICKQGDEIVVLGNAEVKEAPKFEKIAGVRHIRFYYPLNKAVRSILAAKKEGKWLAFLETCFRHPWALFCGILRQLTGYNPIEYRYKKQIEKLHKEYAFDVMVSFSAPYYTAIGLARANVDNACKIIDMMDLYGTHPEWKSNRARRQEQYTLTRVYKAIVTKEIRSQYEVGAMASFNKKMLVREFPCVEVVKKRQKKPFFLPKEKINLLFAGNFYKELRSPTYLLKLMQKMQSAELYLTIMGELEEALSDGDRQIVNQLTQEEKLCVLGPQAFHVAQQAIMNADILINLGNKDIHMLPSKIYEYISTGKPILNLTQSEQCPTLSRLDKYPLACSILQGEEIQKDAQTAEAFCLANAGREVSWQEIEYLYYDCTPEYMYATLRGVYREYIRGIN